MATTLEESIDRRQHTLLSLILSRQTFWVFVAIVLACVFLSLATNTFATPNNLFNITRNFTFTAIIALGMTIVIITGGIDLSVGSVLCLCSMVLGEVMHAGFSIYIGIFAALGTAVVVGLFNGIAIAYVGMPPFVVTLGMLSVARSLAMVASNNTVVFQFGPDQAKLLWLGGGATFGIANPVIYTLVLALLTGYILRWTTFGRYCLRHRRQRAGRHRDRRAGAPDQGGCLCDFGPVGRHRRHCRDRLARRRHHQHRHRPGASGDRRRRHRRRQPRRRHRHRLRRADRRGA